MFMKRRDFFKLSSELLPAAPSGYWLHVHRRAMACRFEVTLPLGDEAGVPAACEALDEVDRLEQQLSVFREESEVSRLNRQAGSRAVETEASLFALLLWCRELSRETEGAFDVTAGPLTRCWGFLRRQGRVPSPAELERARALVGPEQLLLESDSQRVRFARPGVEINLGSVGKGYALDRARAILRGRVQAALLSAGSSSMCALGGRRWKVGIRHPRHPDRRLAVLSLRDCAMSTSGSEEQFFEHDGRRYGHLIDPRSGWPAGSVLSATVITDAAAAADALATACYIGGPELAERYCAQHPRTMVIMLESEATHPVIFGRHDGCEAEVNE